MNQHFINMKNRIFLFSVIATMVISNNCKAQQGYTNRHKVYIELGICGGSNSIGFTAGGYGAVGLFFGKKRAMCIDARAKELYFDAPQGEAGAITLTYRIFLAKKFYLGAGFAHNHEVAMHDFTNEPVGSLMGSDPHIVHRTGLSAETGFDLRPFPSKTWLGVYPVANLNIAYLVMDHHPNPLITLSLGFRFGMKPIESANK